MAIRVRQPRANPPAVNAYTIAATAGSYTLTGTAAGTLQGWLVTAAAGSYALNGMDASLRRNLPMVAGPGSYALTGTDASLLHTWLLVTGSRTNLITRSQELDNSAWSKTFCTVTADATVAPDGTSTADAILSDGSAAGGKGVGRDTFPVVSTVYTWSVYLKGGLGFTWARVSTNNLASGVGQAWFNLNTGAVGTVAAGIIAAMVNAGGGWYRCSITGITNGTTANCRIRLADADNDVNASGTVAQGIYAWGGQMELGTTASVYVPTTGAAATSTSGPAGSYALTGTAATLTYAPVVPPAVVAPTRGEWPEKRRRRADIHAAREARDSLRQSLERLYDGGEYDAPLEVLEEAQTEAMATVNALILLDDVPLEQLRAAEDLIRGIQELIRLRLADEARIEAATIIAQQHLRETIDIAAQIYRKTRFDYLARYALLTVE